MSKHTCSIDDCENPRHARGWCSKHYGAWRHYGDPLFVRARLRGVPCTIEGCEKLTVGRGWCAMHWARWKKHGDPLFTTPPPHVPVACRIAGCPDPKRSRLSDLCEVHYYRLRRTGSAELLPRATETRRCRVCGTEFEAWAAGPGAYCSHVCKGRFDAGHYSRRVRADKDRDRIVTQQIGDRDGWRCHLCAKPVNPKLKHPHPMSATIDHLIPLARGGTHRLNNVKLAHSVCNKRKGTRACNEQLLLIG